MGHTNTKGVYVYDETDTSTNASQMLNKQSSAATAAATPETSSAVANPSTGWKMLSQSITRVGIFRIARVQLERTGAAISVSSTGDIGNTEVCQIASVRDKPVASSALSSGTTGRMLAAILETDRTVSIAAVGGTANIATGDAISVQGLWIATEA